MSCVFELQGNYLILYPGRYIIELIILFSREWVSTWKSKWEIFDNICPIAWQPVEQKVLHHEISSFHTPVCVGPSHSGARPQALKWDRDREAKIKNTDTWASVIRAIKHIWKWQKWLNVPMRTNVSGLNLHYSCQWRLISFPLFPICPQNMMLHDD